MPTLFSFSNFRLRLYFGDHGIPQFHLISANTAAVIAIETGEVLEGDAPAGALETAREWIAVHSDELLTMWRK